MLSAVGAAAHPRQAIALQAEQTITIDPTGSGPVFEGLGAVSAGASSRLLIDYPEPQRSQILDYLFKPAYGAALQHLKVEIGADVDSTDGSEPSHMRTPNDENFHRGYEWWLIKEARERNPKIILDSLAWGAPGWIDSGRFYSEDMARYVAAFLQGARDNRGLDIAYTGVWNEHLYDASYVKELNHVLASSGLPTKIVCCDEYPDEGGDAWRIVPQMQTDPELKASVDVLSVHYPWVYNHSTTPSDARAAGKPMWSSEDQPNSGGGPILSRDWDQGGMLLAKLYNLNYLQGGFTKTEIWSPVTSYYDILAAPGSGLMRANSPWSGTYTVQGAIWATAHTTQFAQPGWTYDDPSCGYLVKGGSYVTFLTPDRKSWSSVIESVDAHAAQKIQVRVPAGFAHETVHIWETNERKTFAHIQDVKPVGGRLSLVIEPASVYSITNTTGQAKGLAVAPPPATFPMPYADNFQSGTPGSTRPYLSDQDGAFEVQPCRFRPGKCLEQVITTVPIPWGPLPDPFSLAGDVHWKDFRVTADVQIPAGGDATLIGRIDSADVFADDHALYPSGYVLILKSSGEWRLISTAYTRNAINLASGSIPQVSSTAWHHLQLAMRGDAIKVCVDESPCAEVADGTHAHGMFSLGSNWSRVQFSNLRVEPVP